MPNDKLAITYTAVSLGKIGDIAYINDEGKLAFFDGGLRRMNLDGTLEYDLIKRATISADGQKVSDEYNFIFYFNSPITPAPPS